ncbi:sodium-dependent serotonin transporter-like isoform X2 [Eurosta solidaginis]|uniref:sodium-dependent serotonin transporter-like isoform X2 n=1 Tax=Eurosta solidaginis TaxID=178769 RepID=UPI003530F117
MIYESSYDSGRLPYKPDLTRGYWAKPSDFIFTGISLVFRLDTFSLAWSLFTHVGCASILPYLISLFLFVVPIFIMQSFLGQFSSSGFISAFRIAPLFKGIGYVSLAVNFAVLTYYSIYAAVPLFYLINSLRPTLPWSCDGIKEWSNDFSKTELRHLCHLLSNDTPPSNFSWYLVHEIPSNLYIGTLFNNTILYDGVVEGHYFSWQLILCTLTVWAIITGLFYNWNKVEKLSSFLRYGIFTVLILLLITVIRFSFVPKNHWNSFYNFFIPDWEDITDSISNAGIFTISAFGVGWGTVISLASFNKFQTKIIQNSWTICLSQMLVFFAFAYIVYVTDTYFEDIKENYNESRSESYATISHMWALFLSTGSVMAEMSWPNLWCILYFTMLLIAALITMTISLLSTLQSLFDEFEILRYQKNEVTFIAIGVLTLSSLYTCSNKGTFFHFMISNDTMVTQISLNLLLLLVVLWIYGRVRFQRDIEFMLNQGIATWKIYMLRFVSPLCLISMLMVALGICAFQHIFFVDSFLPVIVALFLIVLPWLFVPGYMMYIISQTTGTVKTRFRRCVHPVDWYPLEMENRIRYEQVMRNEDMTHQLNPLDEETET